MHYPNSLSTELLTGRYKDQYVQQQATDHPPVPKSLSLDDLT